jgi:tetratricopeptide (TPR) repeat protein
VRLARRVASAVERIGRAASVVLVLACMHALAVPAVASGQTPAEPAAGQRADDARARELYVIGDEFYANGRYEAAEEAFAEAYRLSGRPLLLFNLANAQERSGRWPEAAENLRRYREHAPESEHAALDARLTALQRRIEDRAAESRDEPVVVIQHESAELPAARASDAQRPREPLSPHWVLLPASGGLALTTLALALRVRSVRDDVRAACVSSGGQRFCSPEAAGAITRDRRLSVATDLLAVAALTTAALGVWTLVRDRRRAERSPTLQVGVATSGLQLTLTGAF